MRLSRQDARRIAVGAQLLDEPRPTDLLDVVRRLSAVQVDLTAAVAPSADLVCWSRLGRSYRIGDLDDLFQERRVVELRGFLRPAEDIALHRAEMEAWPGPEPLVDWQMDVADWVSANDECRLDILDQLESEAPLSARQLPDSCVVPWRSTGWTNNKNTQRMLDFMESRGEVAVASRAGRERQWDLASRIYPDTRAVPAAEAEVERARRRLAALGIARAKAVETQAEPHDVGSVGVVAVVEGLRGQWQVDPEQLSQLGEPFRGRTVLLSPLDRLVFDRKRMTELFEFDYQLEMYKPAAKRRWGYWALPILHGDRLVGKLDATADLDGGVLRVDAVHEDEPFPAALRKAVDREISELASWLGLTVAR
ncbi:DNA glycosylase AlkZ-like family protein [Pedococcus dokdonensis]|uniref:DNA glycosylase AlkZ-like family protein n=1 Tax=Pedococcus dokdonensis TaxID=443156 RepID=UPI000B80451C|nr:crosslink repair DNA glycosylase YcaQ family protein [Pedococcus dokdonensis]